MSNELFGTKEPFAYEDVYSSMKIFPDFVAVYIPKTPYQVLRPGLEMSDKAKIGSSSRDRSDEQKHENRESNLERSLRRSRQSIKEYVAYNHFDLFVTLTVAFDRYNSDRSKQKIFSWIKNEQFRKGKFAYIIVPEFHKDKKALHFHGLFKNYPGKIIPALSPYTGRHIRKKGRLQYNLSSFRSGNNSAEYTDDKTKTKTMTAWYLQKYIKKDMPQFFGRNRYWNSRNLKRPIKVNNPEPFYEFIKADAEKETKDKNGIFLYFNRNQHPLLDLYLEEFKDD